MPSLSHLFNSRPSPHTLTHTIHVLTLCVFLAAGRDASVSHSQRLQRQHNTTQLTQDSHYQRQMSCLRWDSNPQHSAISDNALSTDTLLLYCTCMATTGEDKGRGQKACINVHTSIHLWRSCRFISAGGSIHSCSCGMVTFVVIQILTLHLPREIVRLWPSVWDHTLSTNTPVESSEEHCKADVHLWDMGISPS